MDQLVRNNKALFARASDALDSSLALFVAMAMFCAMQAVLRFTNPPVLVMFTPSSLRVFC
ncbi:hypothetical protein NX059_003390 [Plenodomus lindquistii]|nr:hypothetical protein NX059_003390 [Plenodomus lindquistii]